MSKHEHNPEKQRDGNVIPLPRSAPAHPPALLEELNMVRLEGRYFCFDKHEAKKRAGLLEYRDGDRGLLIEVSPRFGHPSILAYKVLQAIFYKVTLEGKPYPDTVSFSYRELARLVGRDLIGGRDAKELYSAIRQLEDTKIEAFLYDKGSRDYKSYRFSVIIGSGFIASGDVVAPERVKIANLTLHPAIVENMRQGYFAIFNWDLLSQLEPLAAVLYKRLYLVFSTLYRKDADRRSLKFEKDYADICGEWLGGLSPERFKSRILKQLGHALDALQNSGLVRSVSIEPKADGNGFKFVFRPGSNFFNEYERFYLGKHARTLQFQQASDRAHIQVPLALLAHFYSKLHGAPQPGGAIYTEGDVRYAEQLIEQFSEEGARDLLDFALEEAPKTGFHMKTVHAVKSYLPAWQGARASRERRLVAQREEQRRRAGEQVRYEYDQFCRVSTIEQLSLCSPDQRSRIEAMARERAATRFPPSSPAFTATMRMEEQAIIRENHPLPSFEQWLANRQ